MKIGILAHFKNDYENIRLLEAIKKLGHEGFFINVEDLVIDLSDDEKKIVAAGFDLSNLNILILILKLHTYLINYKLI